MIAFVGPAEEGSAVRWVRDDIRGLKLHIGELKQTDRHCIFAFMFLNGINSSILDQDVALWSAPYMYFISRLWSSKMTLSCLDLVISLQLDLLG